MTKPPLSKATMLRATLVLAGTLTALSIFYLYKCHSTHTFIRANIVGDITGTRTEYFLAPCITSDGFHFHAHHKGRSLLINAGPEEYDFVVCIHPFKNEILAAFDTEMLPQGQEYVRYISTNCLFQLDKEKYLTKWEPY